MSEVRSAAVRIAIVGVLLAGLFVVARTAAQEIKPPPPKPGAGKAAPPTTGPANLFDLLVAGGPVMIPIGICSVLALALMVERFVSLRRDRIIPRTFMEGLKDAFAGAGDLEDALAYCERQASALSNIFKAGLRRLPQGSEAMEKAIEDAGGKEVNKMKRSLRPLSVIATVSPLLGLLGTVYGMISAFQSASAQGVNKADTLAVGIYEALVTTAAGLTLAIPVLIVYQILSTRVDGLVDHMDDQAIEFLEYAAYGKRPGAPAATAAAPGEPPVNLAAAAK